MNVRDTAARNKWFFAIVVMLIFMVLVGVMWSWQPWWNMSQPRVIGIVALIMIFLFAGWFMDTFTGDANAKVEQMVAYSYMFPFIFLGAMILPFLGFPNVITLGDSDEVVNYPIGIVRGCSVAPASSRNNDWVPDGIRCRNLSDQWLINVGGKVHPPGAGYPRQARTAAADGPAAAAMAPAWPATAPAAPAPAPSLLLAEAAHVAAAGVVTNAALESAPGHHQGPFLLPELALESSSSSIEGGLVVPLYFVVMAVFGGTVSMMRRVPEYQARNRPDAPDYLCAELVREALVFQIMQVFTAPLIAITAFYLVDPHSPASSIGLAFLAGFSSETVLMYIRVGVEKARPASLRDAPRVELNPNRLSFGELAAGQESAPQTMVLANRTAAALSGSIIAPAAFACSHSGPFSLAAGESLTIAVTFKPDTPGDKSGSLEIRDGAPGSPRLLQLQGTAL